MIRLSGFPLPPSSNNLYPSLASGRRVRSREYNRFLSTAQMWAWVNREKIKDAVAWLQEVRARSPCLRLHVRAVFYFRYSRIYCKDGSAQKNDTANRLKALHDALSECLGIDDRLFWSGSFDKRAVHSAELEGVEITLTEAGALDR